MEYKIREIEYKDNKEIEKFNKKMFNRIWSKS